MSSTHSSLHYHVVFSTKDRVPAIGQTWRNRLHEYLGGVVRNLHGIPEMVGGTDDHVHLLIGLKPHLALATAVRDVKSNSSRWVHEEMKLTGFEWQEGYGGFTVSASQRAEVRRYIENQEEHHRHRSFQEEYMALLERTGMEFDPKYLW